MRHFRVEEAEALIPDLEAIFEAILGLAEKAQSKNEKMRELQSDEKRHAAELAIEKSQLHFIANEMNALFVKIADLGALPKGLEPALVDFPARVDGREVYLCWKLGEKEITHYHGVDEGFSGRKRLKRTLH